MTVQSHPTALDLLPEVLLDDKGYPTDEWLNFLRNYSPDESLPIYTFIDNVLIDGWWMSDRGIVIRRPYKGRRRVELHTGGWSGNEDVIYALTSNIWLTAAQMRYVMWKAGGHYYFDVLIAPR